MNSRKPLLRWASGIMVVLGVGHLILLAVIAWGDVTAWASRGMWAAVPLVLAEGSAPTVESLQNKVTFWGGPGGFGVPLILLGCLIWHLAGRAVAVPAWAGWGLAAWCALGGVLLVPSPFFAGVVAGALIIAAARKDAAASRPLAVEPTPPPHRESRPD